jgi:hypothetical protein
MRLHADAILARFDLHAQLHTHEGAAPAPATARHDGNPAQCPYGLAPRITCLDRAVITEYLRERGMTADTLTAGGARVCRLPARLERRLSRLPAAMERVMVGSNLLLMDMRTGRVVDRMRTGFRR